MPYRICRSDTQMGLSQDCLIVPQCPQDNPNVGVHKTFHSLASACLSSSSLDSHLCALCPSINLSLFQVPGYATVSPMPSLCICSHPLHGVFIFPSALACPVYVLWFSMISSSRKCSQTFISKLEGPTVYSDSPFCFSWVLCSYIVIVNSLVRFPFWTAWKGLVYLFIAISSVLSTSVWHLVGIQQMCLVNECMNSTEAMTVIAKIFRNSSY